MKLNFFFIAILVCITSCVDVSVDPDDSLLDDPRYMSVPLGEYEYSQCFYELEYRYGSSSYCDDECCWWDLEACQLTYCNDHLDECEWEKAFDSCIFSDSHGTG